MSSLFVPWASSSLSAGEDALYATREQLAAMGTDTNYQNLRPRPRRCAGGIYAPAGVLR